MAEDKCGFAHVFETQDYKRGTDATYNPTAQF